MRSTRENWKAPEAMFIFVHLYDEIGRQSQPLRARFEICGTSQVFHDEKWPTVSGCLHFLGIPVAKIGGVLRLLAFFDTPMG